MRKSDDAIGDDGDDGAAPGAEAALWRQAAVLLRSEDRAHHERHSEFAAFAVARLLEELAWGESDAALPEHVVSAANEIALHVRDYR